MTESSHGMRVQAGIHQPLIWFQSILGGQVVRDVVVCPLFSERTSDITG